MRRTGLTLVEVIVATVCLALLILLLAESLKISLLSVKTTSLESDLNIQAGTVLDTMVKELKDSGTRFTSFSISPSQQSITFARCVGVSAREPVFGNPITYSVVTYGGKTCLERTEIISGVPAKQILTDQLCNSPVTVQTPQGVPVTVTGANFQMISSNIITVTVAVQNGNYLLKQNTTAVDDNLTVTGQASVQILNN